MKTAAFLCMILSTQALADIGGLQTQMICRERGAATSGYSVTIASGSELSMSGPQEIVEAQLSAFSNSTVQVLATYNITAVNEQGVYIYGDTSTNGQNFQLAVQGLGQGYGLGQEQPAPGMLTIRTQNGPVQIPMACTVPVPSDPI